MYQVTAGRRVILPAGDRGGGHVACIEERMETRTLHADTLRIAAETVGGSGNLSRRLGVPHEALSRWLSGREAPPLEPFLAALEIIEGSTA